MKHTRRFFVFTGAFPLAIGFAAACTDDAPRGGFEPSPDAADARVAPSLPEAESPTDAAKPVEPFDAAAEPVVCAVSPCALELVAGSRHFCARLSDGAVQCWGDDADGALGGGPPPEDDDGGLARGTVPVLGLADVAQISAAGTSTCARLTSGMTLCWGGNSSGQLGIRSEEPFADGDVHFVPSGIAMGPLARIDMGLGSACGVTSAGEVHCWGDNSKGQLTRTDVGASAGPTLAELGGFHVTRTGASSATGYALLQEGELVTWGLVAARPSSLDVDPSPALVAAPTDVNDFAVGPAHACATANGEVFCWGEKTAPLCNGLPDAVLEPKLAPLFGSGNAQQVSVSKNTTCVRLTNGTIQCCGVYGLGQGGDGDAGAPGPAFRPVSGLTDPAVHVATADEATCALLRDGSVVCWGGNAHGELGGIAPDAMAHPTPSKVVFR